MRSTPLKLFAVLGALCLAGAAFGNSRDGAKRMALAEVAGYKSWARVTPTPLPVNFALAAG